MKKLFLGLAVLAGAVYYILFEVQNNLNMTLGEHYIAARVQGNVTYQSEGSTSWSTLQVGTALKKGDIIKTDLDGEADILFASGRALRLKYDSQIRLKTGKQPRELIEIDLINGKVISLVDSNGRTSFTVETPVITMGIKEASFEVEHSEILGQSTLLVNEGGVDVEITGDARQKINLGSGDKIENVKITTEAFTKKELTNLEWSLVDQEVIDMPAEVEMDTLFMDFIKGRLSFKDIELNLANSVILVNI